MANKKNEGVFSEKLYKELGVIKPIKYTLSKSENSSNSVNNSKQKRKRKYAP